MKHTVTLSKVYNYSILFSRMLHVFGMWDKTGAPGENPHQHGEHMLTPERKTGEHKSYVPAFFFLWGNMCSVLSSLHQNAPDSWLLSLIHWIIKYWRFGLASGLSCQPRQQNLYQTRSGSHTQPEIQQSTIRYESNWGFGGLWKPVCQ